MVISFAVSDLQVGKDFSESLYYWEPYLCLAEKNEDESVIMKQERRNLNMIINRVKEQVAFQQDVNNSKDNQDRENEPIFGVFSVSKESLDCSFDCEIVWQTSFGCCFILILHSYENVALADFIVGRIIQYSNNVFNMVEEKEKQIVLYPEKLSAILHVFLPSGQLIFMNHRLVKQFEKELDKILSEKK